MRTIKILSVVAFILLFVGAVGSWLSFYYRDKGPSSVEKALNHHNITTIRIKAKNENVELIPTNDTKIKVELAGTKTKITEDRLSVNVNGRNLSIQTDKPKKLFNIDLFQETLALTVYVPRKKYETVQIELDNGNFRANQLNIRKIRASTNNGRIYMGKINSDDVNVSSVNGKVYLNHIEGNISGKTDNGFISLFTSDLDRSIKLEATNGNIEIKTEKEPTNTIFDIKTNNGKVTFFGKSDWDTVVGKGDHVIKLRTHNGMIKVEK